VGRAAPYDLRMGIEVRDAPERERYEVLAGSEVAGFAQYRLRPGLIAFVHTQVEKGHEGEGLGRRLVAAALDDARARGLDVMPFCPFVNELMKRHAEYQDLVPAEYRGRFGLSAAPTP
jgi:predicted GNAT family acetyltransferase